MRSSAALLEADSYIILKPVTCGSYVYRPVLCLSNLTLYRSRCLSHTVYALFVGREKEGMREGIVTEHLNKVRTMRGK